MSCCGFGTCQRGEPGSLHSLGSSLGWTFGTLGMSYKEWTEPHCGDTELQSQSRCQARGVRAVLCPCPGPLAALCRWKPRSFLVSIKVEPVSRWVLMGSSHSTPELPKSTAARPQRSCCQPALQWEGSLYTPRGGGWGDWEGEEPQARTGFLWPRPNHGHHQRGHTPWKPTVNSLAA